MTLDDCLNIDDLRILARKKLPRVIFDFIEGGVDDEGLIGLNEQAFAPHRLLPRYLVDINRRDASKSLLGKRYDLPFGIGPTGMADISGRGTDLALASGAHAANIPFVLSGVSSASIESVARANPDAWVQLYVPRDDSISADLVRRAIAVGCKVLVVTVDVPITAKRERNIRSGWVRPYKPTLAMALEAMRHPRWVMEYLRHGIPSMETWSAYAPPGASAMAITDFFVKNLPFSHGWDALSRFRDRWPGQLVVKGLLHPDDAVRAKAAGVDGVIVSNHGGRQLDRSITSLAALPRIRAAVGADFPLLFDSGIRRGADIITALCLGADFALVGRATLYGAAAGKRAGVDKAIAILRKEIDVVSGQMGCPDISKLGPHFLADGVP